MKAEKTILVARSGGWILKLPHGEKFFSAEVFDRFTAVASSRLPWWVRHRAAPLLLHSPAFGWKNTSRAHIMQFQSAAVEKLRGKHQGVLNKHGLKPSHRWAQQHIIVSGLTDPDNTLHDLLDRGAITVWRHVSQYRLLLMSYAGSKGY